MPGCIEWIRIVVAFDVVRARERRHLRVLFGDSLQLSRESAPRSNLYAYSALIIQYKRHSAANTRIILVQFLTAGTALPDTVERFRIICWLDYALWSHGLGNTRTLCACF